MYVLSSYSTPYHNLTQWDELMYVLSSYTRGETNMEIRHSIILHIIERVNEHILLGISQQQIENVIIPASKETYSKHVVVHTCTLQALIPVYTNIGIRRTLFLRTPAWILAKI